MGGEAYAGVGRWRVSIGRSEGEEGWEVVQQFPCDKCFCCGSFTPWWSFSFPLDCLLLSWGIFWLRFSVVGFLV